MELNRLLRAMADRWSAIAMVGLAGLLTALALTSFANKNQEPLFEATTALRIELVEGETIADLADDISEAQNLASIAAGDLLQKDPSSLIISDVVNSRLRFVARGNSPQDASEKAQGLLQAFLDVDPTIGGAVDDVLAQLEVDAVDIERQIDDLERQPTVQEAALLARHVLIDQQIAAINARLVALTVQEAAASVTDRLELSAEKEFLNETLRSLETDRSFLGERPTTEVTVEEALLLRTLNRRLDLIFVDYERLFLRKLGVTDAGTTEPVAVIDLTPGPSSLVFNAGVGLIGGLFVAVFAVVFITRARKTVWLPDDLIVPVLGEVPARQVGHNAAESWYDNATPGPRKPAIQALRSALEAQIASSGATIAMTGQNVPAEGVKALAADLASALASAESRTLLVDADFESGSPLGEYREGGPSLSGVLQLNPDSPEFEAQVTEAVESAYLIRSGLAVIPAGPPPLSPADALAGRQFRSLVAAAGSSFDVVIVTVGGIESPSAQVAMQRLKHGILVLTPGRSTMPGANGRLKDLEFLGISMVGAIFLSKRGWLVSLIDRRSQQTGLAVGPMGDIESPPPPSLEKRRSSQVPQHSPDQVAKRVGVTSDASNSGLSDELLSALRFAPNGQSYPAVVDYLVGATEDMLTARGGFGDLSEKLAHEVEEFAFISLRPLRNHRTVASWLKFEIGGETDEATSIEIVDGIERVLTHRSGEVVDVDEWLSQKFFQYHIDRTGGEPAIWQLTSKRGTVSVLVSARRLDRVRIETLIREIATNNLDELERDRKAAVTRGDLEQADVFEGQIFDVRGFEAALRSLIYPDVSGSRGGEANGWIADWSAGMRTNLAPFQQAELLPFDVLTDEEMSTLLASA